MAADGPPDAHLMLVGPDVSGVTDDPEGSEVLADCRALWKTVPESIRNRVHLASIPMDDVDENSIIVNAVQRHAYLVVQKSLVEGFGLTVTEAMWKAKPVIASGVGGIKDQIVHERDGLLIADPADLDALASAMTRLLNDHELAGRLGAAGHARVVDQFLGDRHLAQYVELFAPPRVDADRAETAPEGAGSAGSDRRLHDRRRAGAARRPPGCDRRRVGPRRSLLRRSGQRPGQRRELHRRRPGADRCRRPAAHQRRARPRRLLHPPGHHRGHPGGQLQPGHAAAHRMRRRHVPRSSTSACNGRPCSSSPTPARPASFGDGSTSSSTRSQRAAESTTRIGKLQDDRPVRRRTAALPAVQLHDR